MLLLLAGLALADVAPPPGYEEGCRVARHESAQQACVACDAGYQEPVACRDKLVSDGYTFICQSWGGSFWEEVWCRPWRPEDVQARREAAAQEAKALSDAALNRAIEALPDESRGCAAAGSGGAWALAALLAAGRRRCPRG